MVRGDEGQREGGRLSQLQALSEGWLLNLGTTQSEPNRCNVGFAA